MMVVRASICAARIGIVLFVPFASSAQTSANPPVAPSSPLHSMPQPSSKALTVVTGDSSLPFEGRLFFSDRERQRIDDSRRRGLVSGDDAQLVEAPTSTLNGFVQRSDGHAAVWVDGVPRWDTKNNKANALLPSDVGGPANYLKSTSGEAVALPIKHPSHWKRPFKAPIKKYRVKKNAQPR